MSGFPVQINASQVINAADVTAATVAFQHSVSMGGFVAMFSGASIAGGLTVSTGVIQGVTNTAPVVAFTTASPSSGAAFTPLSTSDATVYIPVAATTTGTVKVTMGPSTGAENTIVPVSNLVALSEPTFTVRVPLGWKVVITITGTTVVIGTVTIQSC